MPPPMQDFPQFSHLPVEIRIKIWESAPVPTRFVVLAHCHCTRTHTRLGATKLCKDQGHLRSRGAFQWRVYPRHATIPPALHSCREARQALLRNYFQPPCATGAVYRHVVRGGRGVSLAFDGELFPVAFQCPFVDYRHDIFIVRRTELLRTPPLMSSDIQYMDRPLLGFDVSRIQHVGWLDDFALWSDHPCKVTPLNDLVALQDLTILGPAILEPGDGPGLEWLDRLAKRGFTLQRWDGGSPSLRRSRNRFLYGENMLVSAKRIQAVLWHVRHDIEISLWHQLRRQLMDPTVNLEDKMECSCSLGRPHTVPLGSEIISLQWLHAVPAGLNGSARGNHRSLS